jgi:hypothetical protein
MLSIRYQHHSVDFFINGVAHDASPMLQTAYMLPGNTHIHNPGSQPLTAAQLLSQQLV